MKGTKKILTMVLTVALLVSLLAGCGKKADEKKAGEKAHIDVIAKGFQHQFWKAVELGSKKAAEELGVTVTFQGPDTEADIAQQVQYLEAAIAKKPAAIAFAALDTEAAISSIKNAQTAGIPIIGFDSGVPGAPEGAIKANASTNNLKAGEVAAENLFALIKDKVANPSETVRIGVVAQESNSQSIVERTKGFVDKMVELVGKDKASVEGHDKFKAEVAGAKVVIEVGIPAEIKMDAATGVASAMMEKSDLIAIYGSNEFTANAIITANQTLNKLGEGKILGVGFDAGKLQLDAIRNKTLVGSITQDPVKIGYEAVRLAVAASKGEKVSDVDTGALWYHAGNMEDANIKPCLYE